MYLNSTAKLKRRDVGAEEAWVKGEERRQAEIAFRLARFLGLVRLVGSRLGLRGRSEDRRGPGEGPVAPSSFVIHPDEIIGIADGEGFRALPPLRRALRELWCREYLRGDSGIAPPLPVAAGDRGWYLLGGELDLVRAEIARTRSEGQIQVIAVEAGPRAQLCQTDQAPAEEGAVNPLAASPL